MIKMVILDVEGVLTPPDGAQIPWPLEGLVKLREYVKQTSWIYALCTGCQGPYGRAVIQALDFFFPFPEAKADRFQGSWGVRLASYPSIFENGAYFYDPMAKRAIPSPLLSREPLCRLQEMNTRVIAELVKKTGCQIEPSKDFGVSLNPPLLPGSRAERMTTDEFRPIVDEALRQHQEWVEVKHSVSAVDILPRGISKASGLRFLLENTGFEPQEVLGIGDSVADEEWLALVGHSAAPANGKGRLRRVDYVSEREVVEGVLDILDHFRHVSSQTRFPHGGL